MSFLASRPLQIVFIGLEGSFLTILVLTWMSSQHLTIQSKVDPLPPLLFTFPILLYQSKDFSSQLLKHLCLWNNRKNMFNCKHDNNCQLFSAYYITSTRINTCRRYLAWPSGCSKETTVIISIVEKAKPSEWLAITEDLTGSLWSELEVKLSVFHSYGKIISAQKITQSFPTYPNLLKKCTGSCN